MPLYEIVFLARQDLSTTQVEALSDQFKKVLADNGGKVEKVEQWGLRTLAYRINKNRKAHYTLFQVETPAEALHEMERQMRLNEDILRHLTVKIEEITDGPTVMMREDDDEDDRRNSSRDRSTSDRVRKSSKKSDEEAA